MHAEPQAPNLELGARMGLALPRCGDRCGGEMHTGTAYGAFALIRPGRVAAVGFVLDLATFPWEAKGSLGFEDREASATAGFAGVVGRWYFLDVDPRAFYADLALGAQMADGSISNPNCRTGIGPGAQLGLGFDTRLVAGLRLATTATAGVGVTTGSCDDIGALEPTPPEPPSVVPALMLRLGFTYGIRTPTTAEEELWLTD